jgi:hypothetical protein
MDAGTRQQVAVVDDEHDARHDLRTLVTVTRTHPRDFGERQIVARLDGGAPVTLLFGDTVTLEILPGAHHLRVHNTLMWKNIRFYVEPGEHLEFVVINRGGLWAYAMMSLMPAPLFLRVERRSLV